MTDSTPPPPAPDPVTPPAAPAAPAYVAAPAVGPKQTLSLVSMILGIVGFLLAFVLGLGFVPGVVAVILGFLGRRREPGAPKFMTLIGIVGGFVAIAVGLIFGILAIALAVSAASHYNY